jgi:hypothetical protein
VGKCRLERFDGDVDALIAIAGLQAVELTERHQRK